MLGTCRRTGWVGFFLLFCGFELRFVCYQTLTLLQLNVSLAQQCRKIQKPVTRCRLRRDVRQEMLFFFFSRRLATRRAGCHAAFAAAKRRRSPSGPRSLGRFAGGRKPPGDPPPTQQRLACRCVSATRTWRPIDKINMLNKSPRGEGEQCGAWNQAKALDIKRARVASPQIRENRDTAGVPPQQTFFSFFVFSQLSAVQ